MDIALIHSGDADHMPEVQVSVLEQAEKSGRSAGRPRQERERREMKAETPEEDNYFSEYTQHFIVQKFVYLYTNHDITVSTDKKTTVLRRDLLKRALEKYRAPKEPMTETGGDRAWRETKFIEMNQYITNCAPDETAIEYVPDERFDELKELVRKYRTPGDVTPEEWKQAEKKLYSLVMMALDDSLIQPKFELPPLHDFIEFQKLRAEMKKLEERVDNLDATSVDLPSRSG